MLYNVMDRSFVLVRAKWLIGQVRQLARKLTALAHYCEWRCGGTGGVHLFRVVEINDLVERAEDQTPTHVALALDQHEAAPVLDALDDEMIAPDKAVVVEEGRVIGFVDARAPPPAGHQVARL